MMDRKGADLGGVRRRWRQITGAGRAQPFVPELKDICCQQVTSALSLAARPTHVFPGMTI